MAAMIATERRLRTRTPGRELVVQNAVNWRTVRGYGELWRGGVDWVCCPRGVAGGCRESIPKRHVNRCYTRLTNAACLYKNIEGSIRKCIVVLLRRGRYVSTT